MAILSKASPDTPSLREQHDARVAAAHARLDTATAEHRAATERSASLRLQIQDGDLDRRERLAAREDVLSLDRQIPHLELNVEEARVAYTRAVEARKAALLPEAHAAIKAAARPLDDTFREARAGFDRLSQVIQEWQRAGVLEANALGMYLPAWARGETSTIDAPIAAWERGMRAEGLL